MSDDLTPVDEAQPITPDPSALTAEIEALRRKNQELLSEKKRLAKAERTLAELPEGTDVKELLSFKQQTEQQRLEAEGNYREAREKLEAQFREREASLQARVDALEAEVKELRIIGPAVAALADAVHDPDEVVKLKLKPEQIDREPDGSLVVVDGYTRVPILDWAKTTLPQYRLKAPKPSGSGAPVGRSAGGDIPASVTNPFAPDSFNLT
ncbi:MAG: hypothetical protein EBV32_06260, partial [Proteobacteria bacterium]|nr:hypothetical protein [Candidatus Fonsibacter lacus]NCU72500.1 hypothetical protein [Candidatus Fonsibacter lacus]